MRMSCLAASQVTTVEKLKDRFIKNEQNTT